MEKIDITMGSKMTINTQNYSSIQPSVSLTIKDVPMERVIETKIEMSNMLSIFMTEEIIELYGTMDTIKDKGMREVVGAYGKPDLLEKMKNSLQNSIEVIRCEL